jgi:hypothetical protein
MAAPTYVNHTAQKNDTATGAPSVTVPASVADGDIIILMLTLDGDLTSTVTWPGGFTEFVSADTTGGTADVQAAHMAWKLAASESGSYSPTFTSTRNTLIAVAYRGAKNQTPLFSSNKSSTPVVNTAVTATASAITTTSADNTIINFTAADDTGNLLTITQPTSYTERYDSAGGVADGCEFSDIAQAAAGSTGAVTSTLNYSPAGTACFIVLMAALEPLASGTKNLTTLGVG